jgi:hypothetical protein
MKTYYAVYLLACLIAPLLHSAQDKTLTKQKGGVNKMRLIILLRILIPGNYLLRKWSFN